MKKTSSIQRITVALLIGYIIWEIGIWFWIRELPPSDPVIRIDLVVLYPVLLLFVFLSVYQLLKSTRPGIK